MGVVSVCVNAVGMSPPHEREREGAGIPLKIFVRLSVVMQPQSFGPGSFTGGFKHRCAGCKQQL